MLMFTIRPILFGRKNLTLKFKKETIINTNIVHSNVRTEYYNIFVSC